MFLVLLVAGFVACAGDNDNGAPADGDADGEATGENETDGDDEAADADPDAAESEAESGPVLFMQPHDGRLYAAAGAAVVTPTAENHPCTMFLGGTGSNRRADGVHDDLEARVLVLAQDDEHLVFVSLDFVGYSVADCSRVWDALAEVGVSRDRVILSSTHTHAAPDTMGIWGESATKTGRCEQYVQFITDTLTETVVGLADELEPVSVRSAAAELLEEGSTEPALVRDSRFPEILNKMLTVARFDSDEGQTVATLVNWHSHPEQMIDSSKYSADFPRWTRQKLDQALGGTTVYISGTVGGLLTSLGAPIPKRTEAGEPVLDNGQPVLITEDNAEKAWSLGYVLGEHALALLQTAAPTGETLRVRKEIVEIPFENIIFMIAQSAGLFPDYDDKVTDDPQRCGSAGCIRQPVHHVQIGKLHLVTAPGELFAEMSLGRPETTREWGGDWGVKTYPAIEGYRSALPEGHLLIDVGLANNEIGYILPASDFLPNEHPDYYEEYYTISDDSETLVREAIRGMLSDSAR
ncbi:MAG: hypothetical protein C4523_15595 [Myxococcales bacterium]|nr:MAG: hypothetical protein C4523_15595 [Myxococcales bacterium]